MGRPISSSHRRNRTLAGICEAGLIPQKHDRLPGSPRCQRRTRAGLCFQHQDPALEGVSYYRWPDLNDPGRYWPTTPSRYI